MTLAQDSIITEGLSYSNAFGTNQTITVTSASTLVLSLDSTYLQTFTGSTVGQIIQLPVATLLRNGYRFQIANVSSVPISIKDNASTLLSIIQGYATSDVTLQNNSTTAGTWIINNLGGSNSGSPMTIFFYGKQVKNAYIGGPVSSTSTSDTVCPRFPRPVKIIGWAVDNGLLNGSVYSNFNINLQEEAALGTNLCTLACAEGRYNGGWNTDGYCTYSTGQGLAVYIAAGTDNASVSPCLSLWYVWND